MGKLSAAKPALEEAERALQTIQPGHISTVRRLDKPPHLIMRIMDGVILLFQRKIDTVQLDPEKPSIKPSWGQALKLMSGGSFLSDLLHFQKDKITEETVELMEPWTKAMAIFYWINKEVMPLKANLVVQENKLGKAQDKLDVAQAQLDEKEKELQTVQAMYDKAMKEKQELLEDAETCKRKMNAATALISVLEGEMERWTRQSKEFQGQIKQLVGDVVLATGFLSYAGPFNQEFRNKPLDTWKQELTVRHIPFSKNLDLISMLTDQATISEWNLQGLPNDELSGLAGFVHVDKTWF